MMERFELAAERVGMCLQEQFSDASFDSYFKEVSGFLKRMCQKYVQIANGYEAEHIEVMQLENQKLYEQVLPEYYRQSFLNPAYAAEKLGEEYGRVLSWL